MTIANFIWNCVTAGIAALGASLIIDAEPEIFLILWILGIIINNQLDIAKKV